MALMGEEGCRSTVEKLTELADNVICEAFEDTTFLSDLAHSLAVRKN